MEDVAAELKKRGRRDDIYLNEYPAFVLDAQLRAERSRVKSLEKELEKLRDPDKLGAKFLVLAREAIEHADAQGCGNMAWLRYRYQTLVNRIPD